MGDLKMLANSDQNAFRCCQNTRQSYRKIRKYGPLVCVASLNLCVNTEAETCLIGDLFKILLPFPFCTEKSTGAILILQF